LSKSKLFQDLVQELGPIAEKEKILHVNILFSILSNKDHLPKANGYLLPRIIIQELKVASATVQQARCLPLIKKKTPVFFFLA